MKVEKEFVQIKIGEHELEIEKDIWFYLHSIWKQDVKITGLVWRTLK